MHLYLHLTTSYATFTSHTTYLYLMPSVHILALQSFHFNS
uniref:Uncharacterized protein n=1 Tax=Anguilla anguilla TaxID=7936 RepID=A0A0E9XCE3_ANGAN